MAVAMCLVAAGMLVYAPALWLAEPGLAAQGTGPYGAGTGVMLCAQAISATLFAELAVLGAGRARRAALAGESSS